MTQTAIMSAVFFTLFEVRRFRTSALLDEPYSRCRLSNAAITHTEHLCILTGLEGSIEKG